MIESDTLAAVIEKQIKQAVDRSMEGYVEKTITSLTLDPAWLFKIENLINQNFMRRFDEKISAVDVSTMIAQHIDAGIDRFQARFKENFRTNGILDAATKNELAVSNDMVVVQSTLVTRDLAVDNGARFKGSVDIQDLTVRGTINTDNQSWDDIATRAGDKVMASLTEQWKSELVQQVLNAAKTSGIDFANIRINGEELVTGNTLSAKVLETSIETTGVLKNLKVAGHTELNNTLTVNQRRVGINTQDPEMALSVWDEEVSLIAGKLAPQKAFVGTSRMTGLALGINRVPQIEIDIDGLTTVKKLRVGQHRISHESQVPGYSGTKGDIVFNSDPKPGSAFAWVCLGGFKWQSLKSAE